MATNRTETPSASVLLQACIRRKWTAGIVFLSILALAVAVVLFFPRSYESEAKVFVRLGRETVALDPTATTGQVATLLDSRANEINSVVAMLKSRVLAEKVVAELGADTVLRNNIQGEPETTDGGFSLGSLLSLLPTIDPVSDSDRAIRRIEKGLEVEAERDSSVISLRYVDRSPQKAQLITSSLLRAYEEEHLRVNRTRGSKAFFDDQARLKRDQRSAAAERLRSAKDEAGLASVDTHRQLLESRISGVSERLADAKVALATALAKAARLQELVSSLPESKITEREDGHANVATDGMRQQLYNLEIQELDLSSRYLDDHPALIAVRQQLAEARAIQNAQGAQRMLTTTALNGERESLHLNLLEQQAEAAAFRAQTESLSQEHSQLVEAMQSLNKSEPEIANLQLEVDLAADSYRSYAQNLEQTRIDQALELDRISNVNTYQPASLESRPVSPRKGIVLALGLCLATISSLMVVIAAEHLDTSLRTPEEVEAELDLPVLVSVPQSPHDHSLVATN